MFSAGHALSSFMPSTHGFQEFTGVSHTDTIHSQGEKKKKKGVMIQNALLMLTSFCAVDAL